MHVTVLASLRTLKSDFVLTTKARIFLKRIFLNLEMYSFDIIHELFPQNFPERLAMSKMFTTQKNVKVSVNLSSINPLPPLKTLHTSQPNTSSFCRPFESIQFGTLRSCNCVVKHNIIVILWQDFLSSSASQYYESFINIMTNYFLSAFSSADKSSIILFC